MARFRNTFGEDRIVPTLGYVLVAAGESVTVADDQAEHWEAGGWTRLDETPQPPLPQPAAPTPPPPAPAASPAGPTPAESEAQK